MKNNEPITLSISIVTYKSDKKILQKLIESLKRSISLLGQSTTIESITIIDNNNQEPELVDTLDGFLVEMPSLKIICNKSNLGYGRAHNKVIHTCKSRYHLILNPDVVLDEQCLKKGIQLLQDNEDVIAVSPSVTDGKENLQYLTKNYPSLLDLLLRALNSKILCNIFDKRLADYENRSIVDTGKIAQVPIISGCCMLCRSDNLRKVGGFDKRYFLYFEDFSLSLEMGKTGKLVYYPEMKIIHFGGNAARKGFKHIYYFTRSAILFFNTYGWKIW